MGLVIKFLGQPYPGREVTIDDSKDQVKFGRGIDCDVGFPEDMAIVSRDHFALRRELGGYKFVINREKPVFLNGRPVYDDQDMPKNAEIQLSGPTGPKLRIERTDGGPSNQVKTEILKPQAGMADVVHDTRTKGNRTANMLLGVAALVAVLGGAGYLISESLKDKTTQIGTKTDQIGTDVAGIKEDLIKVKSDIPKLQEAVAGTAPVNVASIIEKNKESVYIVSIQLPSGTRSGGGTASVVLLPDGTKALATNSHVADIFNELANDPSQKDAKLVVTQPKGPDYTTLTVTKVLKHPGYDVLNKWQEQYFAKSHTLGAQQIEFVPGYDVALLFVDDQTKLGNPLTYAPREEMEKLKAGQQLVLIGYPMEQLNGTDITKPEPTSQTGIITSVTTFFLSHSGDAGRDLLVQHSVPATGGASGSPLFNTKGELVAFLNAGNIIMYQTPDGGTMRQPSAALVNYAQRADMLLDIAEGKAEAKMPDYRKQMDEADAALTKTPDVFIKDVETLFGQEMGGPEHVKRVAEQDAVMDTPVPWLNGAAGAGMEIEIKDPGTYVFAGGSLDRRPIQTSLYIMQKDGSITPVEGGEGTNMTPYSFVVAADAQPGTKYFVVVADMTPGEKDKPKPAPGKVKIWALRGTP